MTGINFNDGQNNVHGRMQGLSVHNMRPWVGKNGATFINQSYGIGDDQKEILKAVQTNAATGVLRRDEWKALDSVILPIKETQLVGINDLTAKGLIYQLGNPMGTTVLESHTSGDAQEAELSMDAISRVNGDRMTYGTTYLPIPIIHADYQIGTRELETSRKLGNPLSVDNAGRAARRVAEYLENMLFTDTSYSFGGGTISSYVNFTHKNNQTITSWTASGKTGAQIVTDVLTAIQTLKDAGFMGPYMVYVPTEYSVTLDSDYSASKGDNTIRDRIMKIKGIEDVKDVPALANNNVIVVQMTSDVVRLVKGFDLRNVQWKTEGGMMNHFKVMTIQVPQIRADQNNKCGIVHMATTILLKS